MLIRALALLNIHFQVGSLILADTVPSSVVYTDKDLSPYDLRLCACRSIVNAVNLALHTGSSETSYPSVLLLDPYPDHMANALIRTGSSLFQLFNTQVLSFENFKQMYSVAISGLEILAEVSGTASVAAPVLRQRLAESRIRQIGTFETDTLPAAFSISLPVNGELFDTDLVKELEQQAADPSLVDKTVEQNEMNTSMTSLLCGEIQPGEVDFLSHDWTLEVRIYHCTCQ